jgi:hypothetical protein
MGERTKATKRKHAIEKAAGSMSSGPPGSHQPRCFTGLHQRAEGAKLFHQRNKKLVAAQTQAHGVGKSVFLTDNNGPTAISITRRTDAS